MTDDPICLPFTVQDLYTLDHALRALNRHEPGTVYVNFQPWRRIKDALEAHEQRAKPARKEQP